MSSLSSSRTSSQSSPQPTNEQLKASLRAHNDSFDQLLRYIPAKYYIHTDAPPPPPKLPLTKAQKKAARKAANDSTIKAAKSEALKKAKLARYDPDEPRTIPEIQAAALIKAGKAKASDSDSDDWSGDEGSSGPDDGSDDGSDGGDDDEDDEADSANESDFADSDVEDGAPATALRPRKSTDPAPSITELKAKLQQRIADIQAHKRNGGLPAGGVAGDATAGSPEEKVQSKEELLEERRRRSGLLRDNRRKKRKAERREKDQGENKREKERGASNGRKGGGKANAPPREPREEREDEPPRKKSKATPPTPKIVDPTVNTAVVPSSKAVVVALAPPAPKPKAVVDASQLSFSTLDFSTTALLNAQAIAASGGSKTTLVGSSATVKKNRHALPKDPNAALAVLEARKERLEKLNPEQREKKEEKDRWEKVELKAGGEKVRDDEKRLKKMAKRQEKIKSKSAKAWSERKETVSNTITAKVEKRNKNLAARVKQAKDKKSGIKVKSQAVKTKSKAHAGRTKDGRPGFEGRKK
ncbi:hypothetical protein RQP46_006243 [Phenoliferia psychrophenolica]